MVKYRPLDSSNEEIRLLEIQSATNHDAPIICELWHVFLGEGPSYECLSYVWGNDEGGTNITIEGNPFRVFENCEAALRRLRRRDSTRTIWIDAVCINQSDNDEKGEQVGLMKRIYQQAHQVCIWLGELTVGSITGVKSVQGGVLSLGWHLWKVDRMFGKLTLPVRENFKRSITIQNRTDLTKEQEVGEIRELLDRPWFTRVWIMQEAVLARNLILMCGSETMEWDDLGSSMRQKRLFGFTDTFGLTTNPRDAFPDETYQAICRFRELWSAGGWNASIYQLLYDFRHLDCKWPQDRIYGFLGLSPAAADLDIKPNYNLQPKEVYISFTRTLIEKTRSLDVLHCVRAWKSQDVSFQHRPVLAYSLVDQSRYHDIYARITDGPKKPPRRGWARLPPGWERVQVEGQPFRFRNHNEATGADHLQSPLEEGEPIPTQYYAEQRNMPPGWTKTWNNLGQVQVKYDASSSDTDKQKERLRYLEHHGLHELPSWVPNWAAKTSHDPIPLLDWSDPVDRYWASGTISQPRSSETISAKTGKHSVAQVTLDDSDGMVLGVEGMICDTVGVIAPPWHPKSEIGPFSRKGIEELLAWEALAMTEVDDCPYATAGGRKNALWRTMIADLAGDRAAPEEDWLFVETWYDRVGWQPEMPDLTSKGIMETATLESDSTQLLATKMSAHYCELRVTTPEYIQYMQDASVTRMIKDSLPDATRIMKRYGEFILRIRRACAHRAMFATSAGYIGLAPWNAKEGDLVCILKGAKTPFLLRLLPGGSFYQLLGEAFIYGLMGGEAVAEDDDENDWHVLKLR